VADYASVDEMAAFKKSKGKVRKLRKKVKEKVELEALPDDGVYVRVCVLVCVCACTQ